MSRVQPSYRKLVFGNAKPTESAAVSNKRKEINANGLATYHFSPRQQLNIATSHEAVGIIFDASAPDDFVQF